LEKNTGFGKKKAYLFKRNVHIAMRDGGDTLLTGIVNVDEFTVGDPEKGMQGRSHSSKNKVIIAIELRGRKKHKIGLAYAPYIDDYSTDCI